MEACSFSSVTLTPRFTSTAARAHPRKLRKNHQLPRRSKLPPDFGVNLFLAKPATPAPFTEPLTGDDVAPAGEKELEGENDDVWEEEELEAISSLFQRRIPQKPGNPNPKPRPLPLPIPHKIRPLTLPTPKKRFESISNDSHKNPAFLIGLAKQIGQLTPDENASLVLARNSHFLRKGSLSMTIRELGHMGLPERALETFRWAQEQAHLVPDDRVLASTVEVLARNRDLRVSFDWLGLTRLASRTVLESMIRGFIRGGSLQQALKLLSAAKQERRVLGAGVYAKLALELVKNPDKHHMVEALLSEIAMMDGDDDEEEGEGGEGGELMRLSQQDCTTLMKVCTKLEKFDLVETLFEWFKTRRNQKPSVVMYTTLIHSRCLEHKYRQALALVWEMEGEGCLFDLPAYRVLIKLFVAANDVTRASRYFSKVKDAGFAPGYDMYKDMVTVYMRCGRLAKCREVWKEAEMAGFRFDREISSQLMQLEEQQRVLSSVA